MQVSSLLHPAKAPGCNWGEGGLDWSEPRKLQQWLPVNR